MENDELYKIIEFLGDDAKLNAVEIKFLDDISEKENLTDKQSAWLEKIKIKVKKAEMDYAYGSINRLVSAIQENEGREPFSPFEISFLNSIKHLKIISDKQAEILDRITGKSLVRACHFRGKKFENIYTHERLAISMEIQAAAKIGVQNLLEIIQMSHDARQALV